MAYRAVTREIGHKIIHERLIHKHPCGRIEIENNLYEYESLRILSIKTTNDIPKANGYFLAQFNKRTVKLTPPGKRGRKKG